MLELVL